MQCCARHRAPLLARPSISLTLDVDHTQHTLSLLLCILFSSLSTLLYSIPSNKTMPPKDTELYDLLAVKPEATDIE
jgi:hypothetical protein